MKRALSLILAIMMVMSLVAVLAGCGSEKTDSDKKEEKKEAATESQSTGGTLSEDDLIFSVNGVSIELNGDADAAVAALGEPIDSSSQLSCHGEGDDKTYTYDGFVLNTYPLDGKDRVLEIVVNTAGITTINGVQVGDPVSKVTETYGNEFKQVGQYYAYEGSGGKSLQFLIKDDKVQEISYYYDV